MDDILFNVYEFCDESDRFSLRRVVPALYRLKPRPRNDIVFNVAADAANVYVIELLLPTAPLVAISRAFYFAALADRPEIMNILYWRLPVPRDVGLVFWGAYTKKKFAACNWLVDHGYTFVNATVNLRNACFERDYASAEFILNMRARIDVPLDYSGVITAMLCRGNLDAAEWLYSRCPCFLEPQQIINICNIGGLEAAKWARPKNTIVFDAALNTHECINAAVMRWWRDLQF